MSTPDGGTGRPCVRAVYGASLDRATRHTAPIDTGHPRSRPTNHETVGRPTVSPHGSSDPDGSKLLPALPGLDDECRAGKRGKDHEDPKGLSLEEAGHPGQSQRIPAPMVRAIDARSITAQVKRPRFAFTFDSFESLPVSPSPSVAGRSSVTGRSLALRPRLATGLPWTRLRRRMEVLDTDNRTNRRPRPWPISTRRV